MATTRASTRAKKEADLSRKAGDEVDAQLARYRSMRDFAATSEPAGARAKKAALQKSLKAVTAATSGPTALPFVIQKHAATRLHYDFRLGWHGVLKSWAVAKGPSYGVHNKRLAVQVEDHPMEYGGFEGIIPRGQYGGGTVMVWDQGTWEPHVDVDEGLRKGSLKFALNGTKLHGNWTLVRMGGHAAQEGKPNWLLIKEHDEFERAPGQPCITEQEPNSAVTGRSLEQIAEAETHVWNSKDTASEEGRAWYRQRAQAADQISRKKARPRTDGAATVSASPSPKAKVGSSRKTSTRTTKQTDDTTPTDTPATLNPLPKEPLPDFLKPQLAAEAENPPSGEEWLHELKLDGYRMQARKRGNSVQLLTRSGLNWTHRVKPVAAAVQRIHATNAILDGEVVVLDANGLSSFARLQASFEKGESHPFTYFVFDLLHLDGRNTRDLSLAKRKQLLQSVLGDDSDDLRLSEHLSGDGEAVFHKACELHAEGIISKRASAKYSAGRSHAWLKSKCLHEQEFVIGGFRDLSNGTRGIGALLLGYYDDSGKLIYAGRTGTGFTQRTHASLRDLLEPMERTTSPFAALPADARRGAHFVQPERVAQVRFATWTGENQLRQAAFLGLREDKAARDVRKEEAAPTPKRDKHLPAAPKGQEAANTSTSPQARVRARPAAMPDIRLTHPQKVIDPESGTTKQQLAAYLAAVADRMLPYIADRPLSLVRCPEGSGKPCFYQKHVNHLLPVGVGSVMVADKKGGKPEPYITLHSAEALVGLAQMTVLEVHPWGSTNECLEKPDRITIDLDPDESLPWSQVARSALEVHDRLKMLGLTSFVKTTGGKGLHVVFPLAPDHDFATIKGWAHAFVQSMERDNPRLYLTKMTKAARVSKIYLDYLRNERGATAVAPYSMRARSGLPVSMPLDWKELRVAERPHFSIPDFSEWSGRLRRDPWKRLLNLEQNLTPTAVARFAGKS